MRASAVAVLAGAEAAADLADQSKTDFEATRQAIAQESDSRVKDGLAAALALALARAGRAQEGIEAASRIGSPGAKVSALVAIAADREAAKAYGEAFAALLAIPLDEARTFNLIEFAGRLPR